MLRVLKYGGSSLDSVDKIKSIAKQIAEDYGKGDRFIIVVSAMGSATDDLLHLATQITVQPDQRELDMLLTAGERISISLMSLALKDLQVPAISFTGSQAGIMTDGVHGNANILEIKPIRVVDEIAKQKVVVIAGFQGVSPHSKDVTTLGRGGSDTTAVAMAHYFKCGYCEFKKDTEGIFDKDPNQYPDAQHFSELSWDEVVNFVGQGAPFLHQKAATMAQQLRVPLILSHAHKPNGRVTKVGFAKSNLT